MKFSSFPILCSAAGRAAMPRIELPARIEGLSFECEPCESTFRAEVSGESTVLTMFGTIGDPNGVTAERIQHALTDAGKSTAIVARINSYGGDFYEGLSIYNLLLGHAGPVTAQIVGQAASVASIVAMGADRIEMAKNSAMMVHNAWTVAMGNADYMRKRADVLAKIDAQMVDIYSARTGKPKPEIAAMLSKETTLEAAQCIAAGFADAEIAQEAMARPKPRAAASARTKRQFEELFRGMGYSRAAAVRMAAGINGALGSPEDHGWQTLTDRISAATTTLERKMR